MDFPLRAYEYYFASYRRVWRGSVVTSIVNPVLYLSALGVGLGTVVNRGRSPLGIPYLDFVAPGLLAAVAMQIAAAECSWPVMAAVRWTRQYHAMLATPLRVRDIVAGHQLWVASRVGSSAAVYLAVIAAFGAVRSPLAILALPVAILVGAAFSAPIAALAVRAKTDATFNALFRFGITPMFLFSGIFFPITRLPQGIRDLAYVTPLWHGVNLCRHLTLGVVPVWPTLANLGVLLAWAGAGLVLAFRAYRWRLER
jgi:lipooligosaccharide transport system permease protein